MKEKIIEIAKLYEIYKLYVEKEIPIKKLKVAKESFSIPYNEEVIVLYDNTVFGSCKAGLAITESGIYWKNDWFAKSKRNSLSWLELSICNIQIKDKDYINFDVESFLYAVRDSEKVMSMLQNMCKIALNQEINFIDSNKINNKQYLENQIKENKIKIFNEDNNFNLKEEENELIEKIINDAKVFYNLKGFITSKKLNINQIMIIKKSLSIEPSDKVYGYCSFSNEENYDKGIAFTTKGVYWVSNRNEKNSFLAWSDYIKKTIIPISKEAIRFDLTTILNLDYTMESLDFFRTLISIKHDVINIQNGVVYNVVIINADNSLYIGDILNGNKHGNGVVVNADGTCYSGEYNEGTMDWFKMEDIHVMLTDKYSKLYEQFIEKNESLEIDITEILRERIKSKKNYLKDKSKELIDSDDEISRYRLFDVFGCMHSTSVIFENNTGMPTVIMDMLLFENQEKYNLSFPIRIEYNFYYEEYKYEVEFLIELNDYIECVKRFKLLDEIYMNRNLYSDIYEENITSSFPVCIINRDFQGKIIEKKYKEIEITYFIYKIGYNEKESAIVFEIRPNNLSCGELMLKSRFIQESILSCDINKIKNKYNNFIYEDEITIERLKKLYE